MDPFTWALVMLVVSAVITVVLTPHSRADVPKPASLEDFEFPQFEEGTPEAVFFGDCWTEGWQVINYGNLRTTPIKTKTGKK